MKPIRDRRSRPLTGRVSVPGDKSISHRALMLAALATGTSTIEGLNDGADVAATAAALTALGAEVLQPDRSARVEVEGWGERGPVEPAATIDAGNSGTTARILLGLLASVDGHCSLTGDESLKRRPMLRVVAPLRVMGATIDGRAHGDLLPLAIRGGGLEGREHELAVASAQVKSALLLAGMHANGSTAVTEPGDSRDHTENMLRASGVHIEVTDRTVRIDGGQRPVAMHWDVPGDISSAMYLIVAAVLLAGSDLVIDGVGLNPKRSAALDVLKGMGADIEVDPTSEASGEPRGEVHVRSSTLRSCTVDASDVPRLIDEIPVLAIAASQADGDSAFHGVGELRTKESDRLAAIVEGLRGLGGEAEVADDTLFVRGPRKLSGGVVESRGDHRMAMAFAVAGLVSSASIRVNGWSCVQTSFPTFLDLLGTAQAGRR